MVIKSYMDEAGIERNAPYCTIAGYIGPKEEWDSFERDWQFVLGAYMQDVPEEGRYFHALEFYGGDKKFRHWKRSKRESFENALFETIKDYAIRLFSSTVNSRIFFSFTEDERRYLTGGMHNGMKWKKHGAPTKPYFLPFQFCMIQGANFVRDGDKLFPIMSWQEQYKMKAVEVYKIMLNSDPPLKCRAKLADDVVFSNPKKVSALQAADLAVYWFNQYNTWRFQTGERVSRNFPNRAQLVKLLSNVRSSSDLKMFDFNGLMLGLQGCNRYIRTSFPTLDQALPSLPVRRRTEILSDMRKVNFRRFLDQWQPSVPEGHD